MQSNLRVKINPYHSKNNLLAVVESQSSGQHQGYAFNFSIIAMWAEFMSRGEKCKPPHTIRTGLRCSNFDCDVLSNLIDVFGTG